LEEERRSIPKKPRQKRRAFFPKRLQILVMEIKSRLNFWILPLLSAKRKRRR
jgi:hypothetical protein